MEKRLEKKRVLLIDMYGVIIKESKINEIFANKIKQTAFLFSIISTEWLKRGEQTDVRVAGANSNNR